MKAKHLFYLTVGLVLTLTAGAGVVSLLLTHDTVITLSFKGDPPPDEVIERAAQVLRDRIDAFGGSYGVRSGKVQYRAPNFIVTLRGQHSLHSFADEIVRTNAVQLHLGADQLAQEEFKRNGTLPPGYQEYTLVHERAKLGSWGETHKTKEQLLLNSQPEMTIDRPERTHLVAEGWNGEPIITIQFNHEQAGQFAQLTERYTGRKLAVAVEDEIFTAPTIQGPVTGGVVQIRNIVYYPRAERLHKLLKTGALPVSLKVVDITPPAPAEQSAPLQHAVR